ncbi:hypothetical protein L6R29_25765 [Myxococcota bacterium]|nr:hypothetical protein [Myxococcota bacterium]
MSALNLAFNELCLRDCEQQTDKQAAHSQMESFVSVLLAFDTWLKDTRGRYWNSLLLRSSVSFYDAETRLAKDYPLQESIHHLEQRKRDFLLSFATRTPIYDPSSEHGDATRHAESEISLDQRSAAGLSAAHAFRGVAVSFPTAERWETHCITATLQRFSEQGELHTEEAKIHHASKEAHIDALKESLQNNCLPPPQIGRDLSGQFDRFFPYLIWSKESEQSISQMGGGKLFGQTVDRLADLNHYAEQRQAGEFDIQHPTLKDASDESDSVKNNPHLRSKRRFSAPEGSTYECFWHLKLGNGRRIHFFPLPQKKEIFVGYIGKHLPL